MLPSILDNPIAVREWRALRRRAADWRIWVGLKWPLDPIVWGAPVVLTYAIAPYGLWAMLACLRGLHAAGKEKIPFDAFSLLAIVFWCYVVAISLVLGATAVHAIGAGERISFRATRRTRIGSRSRPCAGRARRSAHSSPSATASARANANACSADLTASTFERMSASRRGTASDDVITAARAVATAPTNGARSAFI